MQSDLQPYKLNQMAQAALIVQNIYKGFKQRMKIKSKLNNAIVYKTSINISNIYYRVSVKHHDQDRYEVTFQTLLKPFK